MNLIFIPGHMCGPWLYEPQLAACPHAKLADVTRDETVQGMAARLLADHEGPLAVVGLSLGGMVAMEAMAQAPERIVGVCLMATDPTAARDREIGWRRDLVSTGLDAYRQTFVTQFFRHDEGTAARLAHSTLARMSEAPDDVTHAQIHALDTRREMIPLIEGYAGPVEIVVGTEDRVCPPKLHHPITDTLSHATLTELEGTGHLATLEAPSACTAAIARLIKRISTD